jgi:hypothetical protein
VGTLHAGHVRIVEGAETCHLPPVRDPPKADLHLLVTEPMPAIAQVTPWVHWKSFNACCVATFAQPEALESE